MANRFSSLIKLADNPVEPEYPEDEKESKSMTQQQINRGKRMSGPKTRVMNSEDRLSRIENAIGTLAQSVNTLAKAQLRRGDMGGGFDVMDDYDEEEDPMDIDMPDDGGEDELELSEGDFAASDFDTYSGEDTMDEDPDDDTMNDEPEDIPGVSHAGGVTKGRVNRARLNRGRISKDDASSNFGEKDDDMPGNRRYVPDQKDRPATDFVIQGGEDAGYGVNKAIINRAVRAALVDAGVIRKSTGAAPGASSKVDKASAPEPTMMELVDRGRHLSFKELNDARFSGQFGRGF